MFSHIGSCFSSGRVFFSYSRLRGTQGVRPSTKAHVWGLAEVRGTCSGGSKSRKLASSHGEAFRARRAIQVHTTHIPCTQVKKMSGGLRMSFRIMLTARIRAQVLVLVHECTSCSCSSALVLVLECTSCSCSCAVVPVLECSFFGVLERTSRCTLGNFSCSCIDMYVNGAYISVHW